MRDFDLHKYRKERSTLIDRALERYLGASPQAGTIHKAMRYGLFSGGKRLRPILMLASGELFGANVKMLLPFAAAMEMIHSYSMIHDDLPALDDDDFRRGRPTVHKAFGEGIALLAGDALLTEAFHVMTEPDLARSVDSKLTLKLIHEISRAAGIGGMAGGQAADLEAEEGEADIATVEYIHVRKTGALILASVRVGAIVGGAPAKEFRRLNRYGELFGLAFQIADDIMDMTDHSANGREMKKATYPAVVGITAAKGRAGELLRQCLKELEAFDKQAEPLRAIARAVIEPAVENQPRTRKRSAPSKNDELKADR
ncbi:MAG TPA: farnesyl diphosphate synthase [Verrucomicrobiae bacterium]|jgi:geranylgeranyl diphosphate synthase type II|nr:farnesyl diphosphate synthase [Verrucomicrobiae bacterium]